MKNEVYIARVKKYQLRYLYNGVWALINICNKKRHKALTDNDTSTFLLARTVRDELFRIAAFLNWAIEKMDEEREYEIEIH